MLGAIAGDVIGSVFEHHPHKSTEFPLFSAKSRFTDDTVLTVATAHALLSDTPFGTAYWTFGNRYPDAGYGRAFRQWLAEFTLRPRPYGSFGNGSAMRVSPIALAAESLETATRLAAASAIVTHDHPEGIKGAVAVACAVFLAKCGSGKEEIRSRVTDMTGYDLTRRVADIRPSYRFDVTCQGSVPEALICFLESQSFEDAVRLAVSLGGDADTQASVAGAVAEAFYGGVPGDIATRTIARLPPDLSSVVKTFQASYPLGPATQTGAG